LQDMVSAKLSEADKELLRLLIDSEGKIPSQELSLQLGIPLSTVQRRRKRLEETYLVKTYSLDPVKFGFRRIDLLIAIGGGASISVGKELLKSDKVLSVERTIGEHTIDLRVETLVKENTELLDLLEEVEAMNGVRDVIWTEVISTIGRKNSPNHVARFLSGQK
jgi:DNA-binding Lrp family transcriptional regulator